jgi:hypothetical protein
MKTGVRMQRGMLSVAAAVGLLHGLAAGQVADVKVTTDTSIDCSSIQTIARDLYRNCKTDQDKAIATWYFVRRMMFHWPHIPTWDTVELINSYGIGLCGYQSQAYAQICQAGGIKARTLHMPGHVLAEAWYDGDWHFFDCQVGWFVFKRVSGPDGKERLVVASHEDIVKDPSIVLDAVKDGRASKPFFQCRVDDRSSDSPEDGVKYAKGAKPGGAAKPCNTRLVINLRRGEMITRIWGNEGKSWYDRAAVQKQPGFLSLHHPCTAGTIDENDPVNWPYWKPYAVQTTNKQGKLRYGPKRLFGNGRMVYMPDLATDGFREGLTAGGLEGIKARYEDRKGPNLHPAAPGATGTAIFEVDCPYVMVDAWLDLWGVCKGAEDVVAVYARSAKDKAGDWKEVWRADGKGAFKAQQVSLKDIAWEQHRYFVKMELRAASDVSDAGVDTLHLTTVFINNMYALPYFMPGRNTIRVTAAEKTDLERNRLTLVYTWEEQGKERILKKRIDKVPFETTVDVAGNEIPRMMLVTLAVAP